MQPNISASSSGLALAITRQTVSRSTRTRSRASSAKLTPSRSNCERAAGARAGAALAMASMPYAACCTCSAMRRGPDGAGAQGRRRRPPAEDAQLVQSRHGHGRRGRRERGDGLGPDSPIEGEITLREDHEAVFPTGDERAQRGGRADHGDPGTRVTAELAPVADLGQPRATDERVTAIQMKE